MAIKERWMINLAENQTPPQEVANKVLKLLEAFGEQDVEFSPPVNRSFTSGTVEFNLPGPCLTMRTDHGEIKLSAAGIFNSLNVKGQLIKLGLVNTENNNNGDNSTTDQRLRDQDRETSDQDGIIEVDAPLQLLHEDGGALPVDSGETV